MENSKLTKNEAIEIVSKNGYELQNLPAELKEDTAVCFAAIVNNYDAVKYTSEKFRQSPMVVFQGLQIGYYSINTVPDVVWENKAFMLRVLFVYGEECLKVLKEKNHLLPIYFWNDSGVLSYLLNIEGGFNFINKYLPLINNRLWFKANVLDTLGNKEDFTPDTIFKLIPEIELEEDLLNVIEYLKNTKNTKNLDICLKNLQEIIPQKFKDKKLDKFIENEKDAEIWLQRGGSIALDFVSEDVLQNQKIFERLLKVKAKDIKKPSYVDNTCKHGIHFKKEFGVQTSLITTGLKTVYEVEDIETLENFNKFLNKIPTQTLNNPNLMSNIIDVVPSVNTKIIYNRLIENFIKHEKGDLLSNTALLNKLKDKVCSKQIDCSLWKDNKTSEKLLYILQLNKENIKNKNIIK